MLYHCQEMNWQNQCGLKFKKMSISIEKHYYSLFFFSTVPLIISLSNHLSLYIPKKKSYFFRLFWKILLTDVQPGP